MERAEARGGPRHCLRTGGTWLDRGGLSAEAWRARLAELNATITAADQTIVPYLQAAVQLYTAAGDVQAAEEVQSRATGARVWQAPARPSSLAPEGRHQEQDPGRHRPPAAAAAPARILRLAADGHRQVDYRLRGPSPIRRISPTRWWASGPTSRCALAELLDATELTRGGPDGRAARPGGARSMMACCSRCRGSSRPAGSTERAALRRVPAGLPPVGRGGAGHAAGPGGPGRAQRARLPAQVDGVSGPDTAKALRAESDQDTRRAGPKTRRRFSVCTRPCSAARVPA